VFFYLPGGSAINVPTNDQQHTTSFAGFGQATVEVFPGTEVTGGLRFTTETQKYSQTFPAPDPTVPTSEPTQQTANKLTWRFAINHHFSDDISAYASYNRGFKSGGYNLRLPGNAFLPETLDAYEVGLKTELLDRHLRLNVDGFYYDDKNVQVLSSVLGGTFTSNAAAAHLKGVEATLEAALTREFHVSGGVSVQGGRYTSYPNCQYIDQNGNVLLQTVCTNNKTIVTPPESGTITANYNLDLGDNGRLQPSITYVYNAGFFWQPDNRLTQPAYSLVNASLLWTSASKKFDARLWAKNLNNATYYSARLGVANLGDVQEQAPPRTFGVTIGVHM
jgi:iron complex outermembrane receptor protein